ncbi:hypothetical protein F2P56_030913 [Juglans regia]|uniref:Cytochrome P450 89A2-like n=1 Tax=Juglans regia TaxID=51240 RepID=A0A833WI73_JUGRE|nr:hypothetical protein F2P56_030913 [Juglans regia]
MAPPLRAVLQSSPLALFSATSAKISVHPPLAQPGKPSVVISFRKFSTRLQISEVVAKGAKEVEEDDLHKIPYLKAVVLESLRIHPPNTSLIPHTVMEDVELGGYTIPKDTTVNIVTALIGRDPNVWENPMEFRPERLLTGEDIGEEVSDVTAFKMMPFGAGRRMCPGNRLGLLLLQYLVSNLVWNFEFKTVDGEGVDLSEKEEFLVVMKNPVRAYISPRIK